MLAPWAYVSNDIGRIPGYANFAIIPYTPHKSAPTSLPTKSTIIFHWCWCVFHGVGSFFSSMGQTHVLIIPGILIIARNAWEEWNGLGLLDLCNSNYGRILWTARVRVRERERERKGLRSFPSSISRIAHFPVLFSLFDGMENCMHGSVGRTEFCILFSCVAWRLPAPRPLPGITARSDSMPDCSRNRSLLSIDPNWMPRTITTTTRRTAAPTAANIYFWYWIDCNRIVLYREIHSCTSFSMFQRSRPWFITSYDKSDRITAFKYNRALMNCRSLPLDCVCICGCIQCSGARWATKRASAARL